MNHPIKCDLYIAEPISRNLARGKAYFSMRKQFVHDIPLQDDCYKVSIEEFLKENAYLPNPTTEHKLVGEAHKGFF